jgi:hypothetical protein
MRNHPLAVKTDTEREQTLPGSESAKRFPDHNVAHRVRFSNHPRENEFASGAVLMSVSIAGFAILALALIILAD